LKTQLVVEKSTRRILCLAHDRGRRHDFRLFKKSKVHLHPETKAVADSGYQGLQRRHANTAMPKKRSKKKPLSVIEKERNRAISSERVACENVIAMLKRFKIIADRYRNRRRRFLALVAWYRYLGIDAEVSPQIRALVSAQMLEKARILAAAARAAFAVSGAMAGVLPSAPVHCTKTQLILTLPRRIADLVTEKLQNRLAQLGRLIRREPAVAIAG
jgi:DDE superfamily endonuclease